MTATITPVDLDGVVKRADARWAGRQGDEPAAPEYLKVLADAVRPLLGQPVAVPADDGEVQQLRDGKQRLGDLVAELRKQADTRGKVVDRQVREIAELKKELESAAADGRRRVDAAVWTKEALLKAAEDERDRLYTALTLRTTELDEARAERDTARAQLRDRPAGADSAAVGQLKTDNARLADELARVRRDLGLANRTLDEIADEETNRPAAVHQHQFEVDLSTGEHRPCECGQPWIRDLVEEDEPVVPDVEPLTALFGRIRCEAAEAGWTA